MTILLINHYAGGASYGMEFRPYYMAREWSNAGHRVVVLAASYSHLRKVQPSQSFEIIEGVEYHWLKTPSYAGNGFQRILNIFSFVYRLLLHARKFASAYDPDLVIASSTYPMDIYPARRIAKLAQAKLIYEIHDLWPLSPMELGGYSKHHPFIVVMQMAEDYAYRFVDAVISILPKTKEHTISRGLDAEKWNHVPNGILLDEWDNQSKLPHRHDGIMRSLKLENKYIIGYVGGHAVSNSLDTLVEAARLLDNDSRYCFVLVGDGTEKKNLIKKAAGLTNIVFLDPVIKSEIPALLSSFDCLFIGWHKSPLYRFGVSPNKIFDYLMAGKPIIHAVDAGNDVVKEAGAGISIEPENPLALKEAVLSLSLMLKKRIDKMGINGQDFVKKNHDYKILSNKMLAIFNKLK